MYTILILLALAGAKAANVNRHMKLLDIDNHIQPNVHTQQSKRFLTLTRRPTARSVHTPGTTLELSCEAIAAPAPSIHWFKNDAPVYEYDKESNEVIDTNPSSLARVSSTLLVSRSEGPAEYTCLAVSGMRTARASTIVYSKGNGAKRGVEFLQHSQHTTPTEFGGKWRTEVLTLGSQAPPAYSALCRIHREKNGSTDITERSKLVPLAPRILVSYKVYVDTMGSNIVLPCRVKGHPRPQVMWKNNNGTIIKNDNRMKVLRSGELVITSLQWSDMGEFYCKATNVFGSTEIKTFVYPARPNDTDG